MAFLGEYTFTDDTFGTQVSVTLTNESRIMRSNAIPPWDASEFPEGNNSDVWVQDNEYVFPLEPEFTGGQTRTIVFGVSVYGLHGVFRIKNNFLQSQSSAEL